MDHILGVWAARKVRAHQRGRDRRVLLRTEDLPDCVQPTLGNPRTADAGVYRGATVADPKLEKSWQVTRTLLSRAKAALPPPALAKVEFAETLAEYERVLSHNEFELALDALEHAGSLVAARGGVWRDLERAARNMGLIEPCISTSPKISRSERVEQQQWQLTSAASPLSSVAKARRFCSRHRVGVRRRIQTTCLRSNQSFSTNSKPPLPPKGMRISRPKWINCGCMSSSKLVGRHRSSFTSCRRLRFPKGSYLRLSFRGSLDSSACCSVGGVLQ